MMKYAKIHIYIYIIYYIIYYIILPYHGFLVQFAEWVDW